jgi:hypothetical protein
MNTSSTLGNFKAGINFDFTTIYMGNEVTLHIVAGKDRYSILHNNRTIGHIKLGKVSHTWYVVDGNYTPMYLVDKVGNSIEAQFKMVA